MFVLIILNRYKMKRHYLKLPLFLILLSIQFSAFSQGFSNVTVLTDEEVIDASVSDTGEFFTISQPRSNNVDSDGDGLIRKWTSNNTVSLTGTLPNDNPASSSAFPDDDVFAKEIHTSNGKTFAIAQTYGDIISSLLVRAESLFEVPNDLQMDTSINRLVAFESNFKSLFNDNNYVYVLYVTGSTNSRLLVNTIDNTQPSLITYTGDGSYNQTWLLMLDINDVTNIIHSIQLGSAGVSVNPISRNINNTFGAGEEIYKLNNGNIAFEYMENFENYLVVIDPTNPGTSSLNPVHTFGPFGGTGQPIENLRLIDYNGGYAFSYWGADTIELLDTNFNVTGKISDVSYFFANSGHPYAMVDTGNYLKVYNGIASPGDRTIYVSYFQERGIASHRRQYVASATSDPIFWRYFNSHYLSENSTLNISNYQGASRIMGGVTIPESNTSNTGAYTGFHTVVFNSDESGATDLIQINDTPTVFESLCQNCKLDPNDNTQLISGDYNETWVTLTAGTALPNDLETIPSDWFSSINLPTGYSLQAATMDTDPFAPVGLNRFFVVKVRKNDTSINTDFVFRDWQSMRVWVTENNLTLSTDDFEENDVRIYPNPVTDYLILSNQNGGITEAKLYTVTGKEIKIKLVNNRIDMRGLDTGIYLLKLHSNSGVSSIKIIKD